MPKEIEKKEKLKYDKEEVFAGLSNAETGSEKNPNIRTRANKTKGGSTAFGKVQITGTLGDLSNTAGYLKESKDFYEKEMKPRYEKMIKHGNNKGKIKDYNPRYDYGGDAEFDEKVHGEGYKKYADEVIAGIMKEAKDNEDEFVKKWRGKDETQDPEYFKRYKEGKLKYKKDQELKNTEDELNRQLEK